MHTLRNKAVSKSIIFTAAKLESIGNHYIFEPLGLSSSVVQIMHILHYHQNLSPTEILDIFGSSKSNISQRLNYLEKHGYIRRLNNKKKDKRATVVRLTPAGEKKYQEVVKTITRKVFYLERMFSKEEVVNFYKFFNKLNKILDNFVSSNVIK